jgi:hypothetical protein
LSGRDLNELIEVLTQCPDAPPLVKLDSTQLAETLTPSEKPLVFISCGQCTADEIALGNAMERLVKGNTKYDAYFAEQQNSLEGLSSNILSSLARCAAFVGVAHHRGVVTRLQDQIVRASVWVEQEIAIAAFIQHAFKRRIEVALYLQKGIYREGIREQLRLDPIEFETTDEVLKDFKARLGTWKLEVPRPYSLVAEWRFEKVRIDGKRHDYRFLVDLLNNGAVQVTDWKLRVEFPREFLNDSGGRGDHVEEESDTLHSPTFSRLYPGQRRDSIISLDYYVDDSNWPGHGSGPEPHIKIILWSGDMPPSLQKIPMSQLNIF